MNSRDKVKRLASNTFTDEEIFEYQKKMQANGAFVQQIILLYNQETRTLQMRVF